MYLVNNIFCIGLFICFLVFPSQGFSQDQYANYQIFNASDEIKTKQWYGQTKREVLKRQQKLDAALKALKKGDGPEFEKAAFFFERLDKDTAIRNLLNVLANTAESKSERLNCIYILGRLGPISPHPVFHITPYLRDKNPDVRTTAIHALERIGRMAEKALPYLRRVARTDKNETIIKQANLAVKSIEKSAFGPF